MMTTAVAVELEEYLETAQVDDPALARWVAGIKEDLVKLKKGELKTYTLEESRAMMDAFMKKLEEKYAGHSH